ncbi:hypothetical protein AVEN_65232-1 [Araneus ventricosus]|uniref:Uncharacterized protein n=1 Tax=Araneus ventricosus TaxID=182803 RepID=A0A4Y2AG04_ARAVE|nr:hypothetical protein AVEN_65232-1 [Araneus ventricosus]
MKTSLNPITQTNPYPLSQHLQFCTNVQRKIGHIPNVSQSNSLQQQPSTVRLHHPLPRLNSTSSIGTQQHKISLQSPRTFKTPTSATEFQHPQKKKHPPPCL